MVRFSVFSARQKDRKQWGSWEISGGPGGNFVGGGRWIFSGSMRRFRRSRAGETRKVGVAVGAIWCAGDWGA